MTGFSEDSKDSKSSSSVNQKNLLNSSSDSELDDVVPADVEFISKAGNFVTADGQVILGHHLDDEESVKKNIFLDPEIADYYRNIYEKATYEGRHHFDPTLEWTEEEEKKLVWKLEWRVTLWACIMFIGLQVDRGNIAQALSDNMLNDLNMTTNDFNYGNTIFLVSFLAAELPSQLVSKKIGPDRWIPAQITLWSIVAMSQCALSGRSSFFATRALLGLLEGGFIPDVVLWLSYFYTSKELPVRLSFFWTSLSVTTILTSLLAFGLLRMRGINGWAGWRWLFLIEGLFTLLIGLTSFFMMPASPVQTKAWFRPNGWFNEREEKIVVNRVLRDDPSKGDMHNRQAITPKLLWYSITDYDLWPLYIIGLLAYIPPTPVSNYLTLTLRHLGFNPFNTNLLTIPNAVIHIIFLLAITKLSQVVNERSFVCLIQPLYLLPFIAVLRWWPGAQIDVWGTYAVLTLLLGYPYIHAILVGWCSKNSNTVRSRTVSASLYNMCVQAGNVIAANIYRTNDAPLYKRGNLVIFIINILTILTILFTKGYYVWRNRRRERIWSTYTREEKLHYLGTTKDKGNKRLDFRFSH